MQEAELEETCRFCHYPSTTTNLLFHPCKCQGTIRYIHGSCLEKWLKKIKKDQCELCNFKYQFNYVYDKKMTFYKFVQKMHNRIFTMIATNLRIYAILFVPSTLFLSLGYVGCLFFAMTVSIVRIVGMSLLSLVVLLLIVEVISLAQDAIKSRAEKSTLFTEKTNVSINENENERTLSEDEMIEEALKRFGIRAEAAKRELEIKLGIDTAANIPTDNEVTNIEESNVVNERMVNNMSSSTTLSLSNSTTPSIITAPLPPYNEQNMSSYDYPSFYNFDADKFSSFLEQSVIELFDTLNGTFNTGIIELAKKFIKIAFIFHIISLFAIYVPVGIGIFLCNNLKYKCKFSCFLHELNVHHVYEAISVILLGYLGYYIGFLLVRCFNKKSKINSCINDYLGTINIIVSVFFGCVVVPLFTGTLINLWTYESFNCKYLHYNTGAKMGYFRDFFSKIVLPFFPSKTNMFTVIKLMYEKDYKKGYLIYTEKFNTNFLAFFLRTLNKYSIDVIAMNYFFGVLVLLVSLFSKEVVKKAFRKGFFYSQSLQEEREDNIFESMFSKPSLKYLRNMFMIALVYILGNYLAFTGFKHLLDKYEIIFTFNSPTKFAIFVFLFMVLKDYNKGLQNYYIYALKGSNYAVGLITDMNNALFGTYTSNTDKSYIKWKPNKNVSYTEKELASNFAKSFTDQEFEQCYNVKNDENRYMLFYIPKHHDYFLFLHSSITAIVIYLCTALLREMMFNLGFVFRRSYILFVNYLTLISQNRSFDNDFLSRLHNLKHLELFVIFSLIPINWAFELLYNTLISYRNRNMVALHYHFNYSFTIMISYISVLIIWPTFFFLSIKITFQDIFAFLPISRPTICRNAFIICIAYSYAIKTVLRIYNTLPPPTDLDTTNYHRTIVFEFTKKLFCYTMLPYLASEIMRQYMGNMMTKVVYIFFLLLPCYMIMPRSMFKSFVMWWVECYKDLYNYVFLVERQIVNQDE